MLSGWKNYLQATTALSQYVVLDDHPLLANDHEGFNAVKERGGKKNKKTFSPRHPFSSHGN